MTRKFSKTDYICTFPTSVQSGIRKAIYNSAYREGYRMDSIELDDAMSGRLSDIEGIDHEYWVAKANKLKSNYYK